MMNFLKPLALILGLSAHAFAAVNPYESTIISTGPGTAAHNLSGYFLVAPSSRTPTAYTIDLDGVTGGITASSLTLRYGINAATANFTGQNANGFSLVVSSGISAQCINLAGGQLCGPGAGTADANALAISTTALSASTSALAGIVQALDISTNSLQNSKVNRSGDTMTGQLTIAGATLTVTGQDASGFSIKVASGINAGTGCIMLQGGLVCGPGSGTSSSSSTAVSVSWRLDDLSGQANGVTTSFSLSGTPTNSSGIFVVRDGLTLGASDYSFTLPNIIVFTSAPAADSSSLFVRYTINTSSAPEAAILAGGNVFTNLNTFNILRFSSSPCAGCVLYSDAFGNVSWGLLPAAPVFTTTAAYKGDNNIWTGTNTFQSLVNFSSSTEYSGLAGGNSSSGKGRLFFDQATQVFMVSENGSSPRPIVDPPGNWTCSVSTIAISVPNDSADHSGTAFCPAPAKLMAGGCDSDSLVGFGSGWLAGSPSFTAQGWKCNGRIGAGGTVTVTASASCCK